MYTITSNRFRYVTLSGEKLCRHVVARSSWVAATLPVDETTTTTMMTAREAIVWTWRFDDSRAENVTSTSTCLYLPWTAVCRLALRRERATSKSSSSAASSIADARSMMDAVLYSTAAVAITRISATEAYCVRVLLLLPLPLKVTSEEPLLACKTPKLSALNSVWNYFTMLILRFNGFRTSNSGYLTANARHVLRE